MSAPPTTPLALTVTSSTTNEEALDILRHQIAERRLACVRKSSALRARFEQEEANITTLITEYDAGKGSFQSALANRIEGTRKLLDSALKNYKLACDEHAGSKHLTDVMMSQEKIREVERRLLAVEVALQEIERETKERKEGVDENTGASLAVEKMPDGKMFGMDVDVMESIEGGGLQDDVSFRLEDIDESRQNMPPIGLYRI